MNDFKFLPGSWEDDPIGWIFFIVIVILLIFGVVILYRAKTRWQKSLDQFHSGELLLFDDLKSRLTSTFWDNLLLNLPGIFLMIGLLGTFINLGIALNHISNGRNGIPNLTNLTEALKSIGTKFKTSVWGVLANLIFRVQLFAVYGNVLKSMLKDKIDAHNQRVSNANAVREKNIAELADKKTDLRFVALDKTNRDGFDITKKNLEKLISIFQNFDSNTKNLVEGGTLMKESVVELKGIIKDVSESLTATTRSFSDKTEQFVGAVEKFEHNTEEVLNSVKGSIVDFNSTVKESFGKFETGVKNTLKDISQTLETSTTNLQESVGKGLDAMTGETKRMIDSTAQMTEINGDLRRQLTLLKRTWEGSNKVIENMTDLNAKLNGRTEAMFKKDGQMENLFGKIINKLAETKMEDRQEEVIDHLHKIHDSLTKKDEGQEAVIDHLNKIHESIQQIQILLQNKPDDLS